MIVGKKIYLRALENSDIDFMLSLVNDQELAYWEGRNEFLVSKDNQQKWFDKYKNTGHRFIVCDKETKQTKQLALFFKKLGSIVEIVNVDYHDKILAITSHLPHLIAYTIVGTASDLESDLKNDVIKYSASGFRDFTRIASSDPIMWRDIFVNNSEAVLEMLQRFNEDLSDLQKAIRKKDGEKLHSFFSRTKSIRERIIDAGQN